MDPITSFNFVRHSARERVLRWRQARSERLGKRIEKINEYLRGLDADIWPEEVAHAEIERQRLAFRKSSLDAAIYNSTH